ACLGHARRRCDRVAVQSFPARLQGRPALHHLRAKDRGDAESRGQAMIAGEREPRMNANERELILKEEVYAVVSCAIEGWNIRGHGLHEKIYENCLCVEFRLRGIPYTQQERHRVMYKGEIVGEYVPRSCRA